MSKHKEVQPVLICEHVVRVTQIVENGHLVLECTKCYSFLTEEDFQNGDA